MGRKFFENSFLDKSEKIIGFDSFAHVYKNILFHSDKNGIFMKGTILKGRPSNQKSKKLTLDCAKMGFQRSKSERF